MERLDPYLVSSAFLFGLRDTFLDILRVALGS